MDSWLFILEKESMIRDSVGEGKVHEIRIRSHLHDPLEKENYKRKVEKMMNDPVCFVLNASEIIVSYKPSQG